MGQKNGNGKREKGGLSQLPAVNSGGRGGKENNNPKKKTQTHPFPQPKTQRGNTPGREKEWTLILGILRDSVSQPEKGFKKGGSKGKCQ